MVHHSEGTASSEVPGVKPTGPKLENRENRLHDWLALSGFSRHFMWLQQPEVGTGKKLLKGVMSSSHSKLAWTSPSKQKNDVFGLFNHL